MAKPKPTLSTVLKAVIHLQEQVTELPTKNYVQKVVEDAKEEVLKEVRTISKAVDKDAETLVKHDKRITRIESQLSVK